MSEQSKSSSISLSSASTLVVSAATDDIVLGNKCMPYNLGQAIKLYTRATNNRHPVAFLNRSLCYMAIHKPDLAAMDAQRAYCLATGTHAGYQDSKVSRQLYEYADVCERAGDDKAFWATVSPELVQTIGGPPSLVNFQLMKLTIRAEPSPDHLLRTNETFDAFDDLRAKALFRLALALFKCGGGAQRSAISILELSSLSCHGIGKGEFLWFGSKLAITLQNQFDQHRATGGNTDDIDCLMASRYAFFDFGRYSARENDLEALNKSIQELDRCAAVALVDVEGEYTLTPIQDIYQGDVLFTEETILSVSTADTTDANALCYCDTCCTMIEIADKIFERPPSPDLNVDTNVGEHDDDKGNEDDTRSLDEASTMMPPLASDPFLVGEGNQSPLNVSSTSISPEFSPLVLQKEDLTTNTSSDGITSVKASSEDERPDEDDYTGSAQHDSVAAEEQSEGVGTTPISEHNTDKVISSEDVVLSPFTDEGSIKDGANASTVTPDPAAETRLPPPPPLHRTLPSRTKASKTTAGLEKCDCCERDLYWCSSECKALAFACHHTLLCGSDVEELIRNTINVRSHPMTPTVHERSLTMLLLARILSWAQTERQNVLENPAVKILSVAAFGVGRTDRKYVTWSYDTHVVAPLLFLEAIDISRNQIAYDTKFADGQVINMLINLIEKHLHVEATPRSYKKYHYNGNLDLERSYEGKVSEGVEGGKDGVEHEPASKFVHGRLRPLCGLLAKPPRRFKPNVELVDVGDNRIICIPLIETSMTASREASLRVGEPLYLASHTIRSGTHEERQKYHRSNSVRGSRPKPGSDTEENIEDTLEAYAAAEDDDDDMMDEEWNLSDEEY